MTVPVSGHEKRPSQSNRRRAHANRRGMLPAIVGGVADTAILAAVNPDAHANVWNLIWWLSPAVFILWVIAAGARGFRSSDEYQQGVQLESMAAGFLAAMIVSVIFLLLQAARVHTGAVGQWVFLSGAAAWAGTMTVKSMRTR
jgi:hypothetical protein